MGRKANNIIDLDDIRKKLDKAIQTVATDVGEEIQSAFESSIDQFYGSYSPRRYERTENLLNASSAQHGIPTSRPTGELSYEAGITVDSSFMPSYPSKSHGWKNPDKNQIFPRAWEEGIHGFTAGESGIYVSSIHGEDYFYSDRPSAPPKTSPPVQKMEKEFRKIERTIKRRLDAAFSL